MVVATLPDIILMTVLGVFGVYVVVKVATLAYLQTRKRFEQRQREKEGEKDGCE